MQLEWHTITAHLHYPFRIARPGSSVANDGTEITRIIVHLRHDGLVGRGEAVPVPYYQQTLESAEATLTAARKILDGPPRDIDTQIDELLAAFPEQRATVAALDAALHDWHARQQGQPVWKLLGLDRMTTPSTSMTIGLGSNDQIAGRLDEASAFNIIKVKVGTDADVDTLTTLRALAPQRTIRVDANCGWPADGLPERIAQVLPFDLELIEQPTAAGQLAAVQTVRATCPVPLIADEDAVTAADVPALAGVYDGINVKLTKCGGIRAARQMIEAARSAGLKVMLGCMIETSLGVSAAAQLASLADYVDLDGHLLLSDDPMTGLELDGDVVRPSTRAGLGVLPKDG